LGARAADAMLWNLLGKFALIVLRFLESVVLVNLLGDREFGAFSQATNLNAIVVLLAAFGFEHTLLRFLPETYGKQGQAGERRLVWRLAAWRLAALGVVAAALWSLAPQFARWLWHDEARAVLVKITALLTFAMGFDNLFARVLVARYEQRFINLLQAGLTAAYLLAAAMVVAFGGGVGSVLACVVAMHSLTALFFVWRWQRPNPLPPAAMGPAPDLSLTRLVRFSAYNYVNNMLMFVFQKGMDVILLGVLLTDLEAIAWYVVAFNLVLYSVSFFSNAFSEGFLLAMVSEVAGQGDRPKLRRAFTVATEYLFLFVTPVFLGGLLVGDELLHLFYPDATARGAMPSMYVLWFGLSFTRMSGITSAYLLALGKERTLVRVRLTYGLANFVLDLALIPLFGALGAAIATSVAVSAGVAYEWWLVHRLVEPEYPRRFFVRVAVAGAVMALGVWGLDRQIDWPRWAGVPALLLTGAALFAGSLFVLRPFRQEHANLLRTLPLPWKDFWLPRLTQPSS
jgi:O-antigen/teichoic acid export membrane protein